jgi:Fe-S cluster biogenesis protein NfuA/nitrite reductase/ring-hydroxylating ferredoxin subunit
MDDGLARERVARVETLLEEVEALADPAARDRATELVQALLDLYGEGLERIVDQIAERDDGRLAEALAGDELVSHLLLLHGLHPVPLRTRVHSALDEVRPYLESHGGDVELLGVEEGVVRLRLEGSCSGCPSSAATLKLAIEDAIHKAAPDVERIEADGAGVPAVPGLVQLQVSDAVRARPQNDGAWAPAGALADLAGDGPWLRQVEGVPVLFLRLGRSAYAYRPDCPACGESLGDGVLDGARLRCLACGSRYDVRHAGRGLDAGDLHLDPVPLLVDAGGLVKVALGAPA